MVRKKRRFAKGTKKSSANHGDMAASWRRLAVRARPTAMKGEAVTASATK
jgi:hypothetical protein